MAAQIAADAAAEYTLYCFAQSGNCYTGWRSQSRAPTVDYFGGETRTPADRKMKVLGGTPVLSRVHPYHLTPAQPRSEA